MSDNNNPAPAPAPAPLSEQDINNRIEQARQEEKRKLYSEMEHLKKQVGELDLTAKQVADLQKQLSEAQAQLQSLSKARTAGGEVDTLALARQVADDTRRLVAAEKDAEVASLRQRLDVVERENKEQRLSAFRRDIIAKYQGKIIEALVVGGSEDEILRAAETAAKEYENIVARSQASSTPSPAPGLPPTVQPKAVNGGGTPPASGVDAFQRTRSPAAFASKRQEVLAGLKARYG